MNPLLEEFTLKYGAMPFDKVKEEHFLPAITKGIELAKAEIEEIKNNPEAPTFQNTVEAYTRVGNVLNDAAGIFFNLNGANTNDTLQEIAREVSPMLSAYGNDIILDAKLFERFKAVYDNKSNLDLNEEQTMLLEKNYKSFVRNGALLNDEQKNKLRAIDEEMSKLGVEFGQRNLNVVKNFKLVVDNEKDIEGIPEGIVEAAKMTAKEKGEEGKYVFTLDYPSCGPFMTYCQNSELRKQMYMAMVTKSALGDEDDTQDIIKRIAVLRYQRAQLLGYETHSHFVLEERMAGSPETVLSFLRDMNVKAKPFALKDKEELAKFAKDLDGVEEINAWDMSYYVEKLQKEKLAFDDEMLRPYFKLENVIDGAFEVANRLYGLSFEKIDLPVYHEDVTAYEVKDNGKYLGLLYADFFPRAGKRAGAWATSYKEQEVVDGKNIRPHASIVCNFTKPTETKPSLITFREVQTLFHEFGHALHTLLADSTYSDLSGTSVYWDFVELPSQVMENWTYEKETLDIFAKHYETGELIPAELVSKLKDAISFREGSMTLRQASLALIDMAWHSGDPSNITSVEEFEVEAKKETSLYPHVKGALTSTAFGHIFAGGYSSGYYSYKWAEVLDADAFEMFKETGIFNKETAKKFRDNILSKGGTKHPMELYKAFRGKEPSVDALLKRAGLQ